MTNNGELEIVTHGYVDAPNKKRVEYIDIARGIAIILMVIGHVVDQGIKRNIIFSFHMPLFIIISGIFYKEKGIKEFIKDTTKKLIIPYIITIFIVDLLKYCIINNKYSFIDMIIMYVKQILLSYSYLKVKTDVFGLGVLWFIPLLICIRIIFIILKKMSKDNDLVLFFLCILVSYFGYIISNLGYWLPWSFDVAMASVLFYCVGYIIKKYNLLDKILKNNYLLSIMMLIWILTIKFGCIELAIRKYPGGIYCFIGAICGSLLILKLSLIIEKYMKKLGKILVWYGKNSMYILMVHHIEWSLINYNFINNIHYSMTIIKLFIILIKMSIITVGVKIINIYQNLKIVVANKNLFDSKLK